MTPRDILICTVGTSLLSNARRQEESPLHACAARGDWAGIAAELLRLPPEHRECGAEINSIASMVRGGWLPERTRLLLLVSDTPDGRDTGEILTAYFHSPACPVGFGNTAAVTVAGLQDSDPRAFRNKGLRELVRIIGDAARRYGANRMAINATGGYKAQISFAGLIGQSLGMPVYYLFEAFSEVIDLPPQPVALDFALWLEHYDLLSRLEQANLLPRKEVPADLDDRLLALLHMEEIDGAEWAALSPIGELFHMTYRLQFPEAAKRSHLLPPELPDARRRAPTRELVDQHWGHLGPRFVEESLLFLRQVYDERRYVRGFHTFYTNPDLASATAFRAAQQGARPCIELTYGSGGKTAKFEVEVDEGATMPQVRAAVADLQERFCAG